VAEARSLLEMGGELGIDFVRVFAGWQASNPSSDWRLDVVTHGLEQLIDIAVSADVKLALETHDVFSSSGNVLRVLERLQSPYVVALWDFLHPCKVDETPNDVCTTLDGRVGYVHVKDARRNVDAEGWTPVSLGHGEVPVREAVQLLHQGEFDGYYVVEIEKFNHPDLAEPEISLPTEIATLKEYLMR
jgi:sugar phosphate isomerase/epimerase